MLHVVSSAAVDVESVEEADTTERSNKMNRRVIFIFLLRVVGCRPAVLLSSSNKSAVLFYGLPLLLCSAERLDCARSFRASDGFSRDGPPATSGC